MVAIAGKLSLPVQVRVGTMLTLNIGEVVFEAKATQGEIAGANSIEVDGDEMRAKLADALRAAAQEINLEAEPQDMGAVDWMPEP